MFCPMAKRQPRRRLGRRPSRVVCNRPVAQIPDFHAVLSRGSPAKQAGCRPAEKARVQTGLLCPRAAFERGDGLDGVQAKTAWRCPGHRRSWISPSPPLLVAETHSIRRTGDSKVGCMEAEKRPNQVLPESGSQTWTEPSSLPRRDPQVPGIPRQHNGPFRRCPPEACFPPRH